MIREKKTTRERISLTSFQSFIEADIAMVITLVLHRISDELISIHLLFFFLSRHLILKEKGDKNDSAFPRK